MNMDSMLPEEIGRLIAGHLTNSLNSSELARLETWIQLSDENRKHFNDARNTWLLSDQKKLSEAELEDSWFSFRERLETNSRSVVSTRKIIPWKLIGVAASWVICLGIGYALSLILKSPDEPVGKPIEISVPFGSRSHISMPDGTSVWLNAGTTIHYDQNYGQKTRTISLQGEAYFDVAKDKKHPFIVSTREATVRALGTRFNVKAYPNEKTFSATLEEGEIDVRLSKSGGQKFILKPNEKIVFLRSGQNLKMIESSDESLALKSISNKIKPLESKQNMVLLAEVKTELYTSWKDPRWIIEGEQLGVLSPLLERRFNVQIEFASEELKKYKFSGTIENETINQILDALKLTAPVDYTINRNSIILSMDKASKDKFGKIMQKNN
jgi:ferric-dicitrate binding protein FerR (iron transport regulator)